MTNACLTDLAILTFNMHGEHPVYFRLRKEYANQVYVFLDKFPVFVTRDMWFGIKKTSVMDDCTMRHIMPFSRTDTIFTGLLTRRMLHLLIKLSNHTGEHIFIDPILRTMCSALADIDDLISDESMFMIDKLVSAICIEDDISKHNDVILFDYKTMLKDVIFRDTPYARELRPITEWCHEDHVHIAVDAVINSIGMGVLSNLFRHSLKNRSAV